MEKGLENAKTHLLSAKRFMMPRLRAAERGRGSTAHVKGEGGKKKKKSVRLEKTDKREVKERKLTGLQ